MNAQHHNYKIVIYGHFISRFLSLPFFDNDMSCHRGHGICFCVSVAVNKTASALGAVQPQALATNASSEPRSLGEDRQWRHAWWVKDTDEWVTKKNVILVAPTNKHLPSKKKDSIPWQSY